MRAFQILIFIFFPIFLLAQNNDDEGNYLGFDFLPVIHESDVPIESIIFKANKGNVRWRARLGFNIYDWSQSSIWSDGDNISNNTSEIFTSLGFEKPIKKERKFEWYWGVESFGSYYKDKLTSGMTSDTIYKVKNESIYTLGINLLMGYEISLNDRLRIDIESSFVWKYQYHEFLEDSYYFGEITSQTSAINPEYRLYIKPILSLQIIYKL